MSYAITFDATGGLSLEHHGIKGMRWGIRRYQNEDGSLTAAGRRRYGADLDINDLSRRNIARIRKGEALRRLDVAKSNNSTNATRIAELQGRVRSAKRAERAGRAYDKGAARAAKGETIFMNKHKQLAAVIAAEYGVHVAAKYLGQKPMYANQKMIAAGALCAARVLGYGYAVKKGVDSYNIQRYRNMTQSGQSSKKAFGSQEYADVVERRKKGLG